VWFEFITNTDCNWNCEYCAFDKVADACMTYASINRHQYVFDYMKTVNEKTIVLEGGEIGLIKDNYLVEHLLKKFDQQVIINTNGEFFKQGRVMLYPYIDKVFYHVAQDAKTKIHIEPLDVPFEVVYGIVSDDETDLEEFVKYNRHLPIGYAAIEKTVLDETLFLLHSQARHDCQTLNPFASIDLAREVLCMCTARGCHVTIPLTEENFIKVLTEYNNFGHNDMCDTCYRTCTVNTGNYIKERKEMVRNALGK